MVVIYLGLCLIYLTADFDAEIDWKIKLLPEIMLVGIAVLALLSKITDPLFQMLFPWPQIGPGKTKIRQVSWISKALLINGYRPLYLLLSVNPFNWWFTKLNESPYLYNKRRAARAAAKKAKKS